MNAVSKSIIACSIAAASIFGAANANAGPFTVDVEGRNFSSDRIIGDYTEVATFNDDGTFNVSLYWDAGQFSGAKSTGLGELYSMYATYTAQGTYSTSNNVTTFLFSQSTGDLNMYLDLDNNTKRTAPGTGSGAFTLADNDDDRLLATGKPLAGEGTLNPYLSTCESELNPNGSGINCGSFGSTTSFSLTDFGKTVFVAPNPFYTLSFQSGQLNNFTPTDTVVIEGSLDVVFQRPGEVPEPASVGLLGLGMLGLYAARRRNKKAA